MTNLRIKITKEVLQKSKDCLAEDALTNCAIALAVRDIFPYAEVAEDIDVYSRPYHLWGASLLGTILLPAEATQFIKKFDTSFPEERVAMEEMEFEVTIPDSIVDHISIEEIKNLLKESTTLELIES